MSIYKIVRHADGSYGDFGPDVDEYQPVLGVGDTLEYSDVLPEIQPPLDYQAEAQAALDKSDLVALRCFKNGVPFPAEWATYCAALRAIVVSSVGPLPVQPAYPEGS